MGGGKFIGTAGLFGAYFALIYLLELIGLQSADFEPETV